MVQLVHQTACRDSHRCCRWVTVYMKLTKKNNIEPLIQYEDKHTTSNIQVTMNWWWCHKTCPMLANGFACRVLDSSVSQGCTQCLRILVCTQQQRISVRLYSRSQCSCSAEFSVVSLTDLFSGTWLQQPSSPVQLVLAVLSVPVLQGNLLSSLSLTAAFSYVNPGAQFIPHCPIHPLR